MPAAQFEFSKPLFNLTVCMDLEVGRDRPADRECGFTKHAVACEDRGGIECIEANDRVRWFFFYVLSSLLFQGYVCEDYLECF